MEAKELTVMANKLAMTVKQAKKAKTVGVTVDLETATDVAKACTVLGRIIMLAEADAELADPDARLTGHDAGRAEVWGLILQELDQL